MLPPLHRFVIIVGIALPTYCQAEDSLCNSSETVYFSCRVERTNQLVSLGGSTLDNPERFWLQYRYGSPGALELVFPRKKSSFLESGLDVGFYRRANGLDTNVSFTSDNWSYTVFHWAPGEGETEYRSGIFVARKRSGPGRTLNCAKKPNLGKNGELLSLAERFGKD